MAEKKQRKTSGKQPGINKQGRDFYLAILDGLSNPIWRSGTDAKCDYFNKAWFEATGRTIEQEMGDGWAEGVHPDDLDRCIKTYLDSFHARKPFSMEYRLKYRDGTYHWLLDYGNPFNTPDGTFAGYIGACYDINDRKQAEDTLKESEEKYYTLIENATEGISVTQDGVRKFVNKKLLDMLGYSKEELIGRPLTEIIHPDDREAMMRRHFERMKGETSPSRDARVLTKEGTYKWFGFNGISIRWEDRPASLSFITDINEQKKLEEERRQLFNEIEEINAKLSQSNRDLQDFALVVSSTLQEPLRKIKAFSELLQNSLAKTLDEDQQENFHFVIDGAGRMQSVINDLRMYSQITTKAKESDPVDIRSLIEDLMRQELETQLKETKGTIQIIDPLLTVYGDVIQMRQLLFNLLNDGLKFHKKGIPPKITVRSKQAADNMVLVEIQDNGIGIAREHHENIFSMLFMLHPRTQYGGSGMGLAIAKQIVNRAGGEIGVKSAPGMGSTFWFTLPSKPTYSDRETD